MSYSIALWDGDDLNMLFGSNVSQDTKVLRVVIDSRDIKPGDLFVALKGENHDGNNFVAEALAKGAVCAIASKVESAQDPRVILVQDGLEALRKMAEKARSKTRAKIVGVTGSVGKTTTKEMLKHALGKCGKVYASVGNFNNHFGLPLCLANLPEDVDFGVLELGMSAAGEIHQLSMLAKPDIAIVTMIAPAHLEFFPNIAEIAKAKAEIFDGVSPGGCAIINYDSPCADILEHKASSLKLRIIKCGRDVGLDCYLQTSEVLTSYTAVTANVMGKELSYKVGVLGHQHAMNSIVVLSAVHALGANVELAAEALASFAAAKGRGEVKHSLGRTITMLDESYNSSPAALKATILTLAAIKTPGRKVVILGDMKELGETAVALHREIATVLQHNGIDKVFTVGALMQEMFNILPRSMQGVSAASSDLLTSMLAGHLQDADVILIKGSRSMRMEQVVGWIEKNV